MAELSEQILSDLVRLRAREGPSVAVKQRVLTALEFEFGGGDGGDGADGADAGGEPSGDLGHAGADSIASAGGGAKLVASAGYAAKVIGVTLAMTGAGLLTLKLGVAGVQAARSKASAAPIASVEAPADPPAGPAADGPDASPDSGPSEVAAVAPEPQAETKIPASRPAKRESPSADTGAAVDTLARELALLDAARKAPTREAALTELERHLQDYPEGQLAHERELMRVETLCALGRPAEARALAQTFSSAHPSSPLVSRMRAACPSA